MIVTTMASSAISLPGQYTASERTLASGTPEGAQMLARARPVGGWGTSKPGRERGVRADGLQGCPAPRLPGCRALQRATPGSRGHWLAGRTSTVAFAWKFMQDKAGSETDCLHLFLKEPLSGRVKIFAKGPLECRV